MEITLAQNNIRYRFIIRDEKTKKSKSLGIYDATDDLDVMVVKLKDILDNTLAPQDDGL